ncbi:MAG: hypothetical protein FWB86_11840 [Treponema sp.]|nr:hypothetical protein [Treponema sp.]
MKTLVYKGQEDSITENYDFSNCAAEEIENALLLHCESAGIDPATAEVAIVVSGEREIHFVKLASERKPMSAVSAELLKLHEKDKFANGYDCYCDSCQRFISVKYDNHKPKAYYCPFCGEAHLVYGINELLRLLKNKGIDPVYYCNAFPIDEPIPQSRTLATPREVSVILDLVAIRRHNNLSVTAENVAGPCDTSIKIVRSVFEELHITETEACG